MSMMGMFRLLFLYIVGSLLGYIIELLFRKIFTAKKWINPGFFVGPYLPIYGIGVVSMYLITNLLNKINIENEIVKGTIIILTIAIIMTLIEYITGLIFIKGMHIRLWDYSNRKGNISGIICPLFSFFWLIGAILYYLIFHEYVVKLSIAFDTLTYVLFFMGIYVGIFIVDICYSFNIANKISTLAKESKILVRYEHLKNIISENMKEFEKKRSFFFPFKSPYEIKEYIRNNIEKMKEKFNQNK